LFGWTLWTFARHRTTVNPYGGASALCTGGPFHFSRNPIYLGDWFILAGVSLLLGTVWPLVFAPLIDLDHDSLRRDQARRSPPRSEIRRCLPGLHNPCQALDLNCAMRLP